MNFVINVEPGRERVAIADVFLRSDYNAGRVRDADVVYVEFRHDEDSRRDFVCLVYRLPVVKQR